MMYQPNVYGIVTSKLPREVILLNTVGGCSWSKCAFCDYCNTYGRTALEARKFNQTVLSQVSGLYGCLQVLCSANFAELPTGTWYDLKTTCQLNNITHLIIETHWIHRDMDLTIREFFRGIQVEIVYGIESFDFSLREIQWFKGYGKITLEQLCQYADSVSLLIGVRGQTMESITQDIETALRAFRRVYVYAYEPNSSDIQRDNELMDTFYNSTLFNRIKADPRVEVLDGLDRRAPDNLGYVGTGAR